MPAISAQSMDPEVAPIGKLNRCFFGTGRRMHDIHLMLRRISCSEAPVLIQGETGSGKEVLAREIHAHSLRANRPFLKLNCAALPAELVESELFGYEKGAFTGAFQRKAGMFEVADGGTILLDEIGDMDLKLQAKLLQVLQDKEFPRLGGKEMIRVDIRIMAATHRDLEQAIPENTFREDLYYRLNVINIELPPLRERADDIPALADYFIQKYSENQPVPVIGPKLGDALVAYDWPGNIRELENVMRRFLILRDEESLTQELIAKTAKRRRIVANREVAAAAQAQAVAAPALAEPARWSKVWSLPMVGVRCVGPQVQARSAFTSPSTSCDRSMVMAERRSSSFMISSPSGIGRKKGRGHASNSFCRLSKKSPGRPSWRRNRDRSWGPASPSTG